jgi:hypothetical protein
MLFQNVTWHDPNERNQVIRIECCWTLQISRDNIDRVNDEEDDHVIDEEDFFLEIIDDEEDDPDHLDDYWN